MKTTKKHKMENISDNISIIEIKDKISTLLDLRKEELRLFFGGSELLDEQKLYQHNIEDEFTIQYICRKAF